MNIGSLISAYVVHNEKHVSKQSILIKAKSF